MQLDNRSSFVLKTLLSNPFITSNELVEEQGISKRQLTYSLQKINGYLEMKGLSSIKRNRHGVFMIPNELFVNTQIEKKSSDLEKEVFTEDQRMLIILLIVLTSTNELSLVHFSISLKVSKNTILNDMKQIRSLLQSQRLKMVYSRKRGYSIDGDEYSIRKTLITVIRDILEMDNGKEILRKYGQIDEKAIKKFQEEIFNLENRLHLKFTDERIEVMPYIFLFILRRIQLGYFIEHFRLRYEEIADTKEYLATEKLLSEVGDISKDERLYIALHLLSTNLHSSKYINEDVQPQIREAMEMFLNQFERKACVVFRDKEQLISKLLLHAIPAYYRIKYQLTELNKIDTSISMEFKELHYIVKQSITPFVKLFDQQVPENEIIYFSIMIGGWLSKQGDTITKKTKAIVVCPHGISISRMLMYSLEKLFPDFIFLGSMSIREFNQCDDEFQIVFTNTPLVTEKQQYVLNKFPSKTELQKLKNVVLSDLHGYTIQQYDMDKMIHIIKNNTQITDENKLREELNRFLIDNQAKPNVEWNKEKMDLTDFITEDRVQFVKSIEDWKLALQLASRPLIKDKIIEPRYIDAIITNYNFESEYLFIGEKTVIPHTDPKNGANKVGMSVLVVEEGVFFTTDKKAFVVVLLSAVDREQHLKALLQLTAIAQNPDQINAIIKSNSYSNLQNKIKHYTKEES
ncbi:BglG family transcription antiterminator [Gracilibacillus suaedae]|uniref:BglG family transcription antiterminator n=1 Tax=Gracilibacillus suaedae TaxID=2820273 RepID=UPI001ABEBCA6|nr:BglG family transcription antiterminator [Gracilibacillus suaedae]